MRLGLPLSALTLVLTLAGSLALNQREFDVIRAYSYKYGYDGQCQTRHGILVIRDWPLRVNQYLVYSTGVPNHPVHQTNPNNVRQQIHAYYIPKNPGLSGRQLCVPMGEVGFALNGVPLFNPLTGEAINAVQGENSEQFDGCHGHPAPGGEYHYHQLPGLDCIFPDESPPDNGNGTLMGVALDGFPIYYWAPSDHRMSNFEDTLDECHGTSRYGGTYRYYITDTFPYIIGCFKGTILGSLYGGDRTYAECPRDFYGKKTTLCSCPRGGPPPGGARGGAPQGGRPQGGPPPGGPPQGSGDAQLLAYRDITDSECFYPFDCTREHSVPERGCSTKQFVPKDCNNYVSVPCTRPRRPVGGNRPPRNGQQQPQNGQAQPQNNQPQQNTNNQRQPPSNDQRVNQPAPAPPPPSTQQPAASNGQNLPPNPPTPNVQPPPPSTSQGGNQPNPPPPPPPTYNQQPSTNQPPPSSDNQGRRPPPPGHDQRPPPPDGDNQERRPPSSG